MGIFSNMAAGALGRAGKGAGLGAGVGFANSGDLSGTLSGAGFGAATGVFGGAAARNLLKGNNVARMGSAALERAGFGMTAGASRLGNRSLFNASMKARSGLGTAANYIGNNSVGINKWGGRAAAALGMGSGAMIGSSMINSNKGF